MLSPQFCSCRSLVVSWCCSDAPHPTILISPHNKNQQPCQCVIAFPNLYAASFGEIGSPQFVKWTRALVEAGARVRACVMWQLDYARRL